MWPKFLTRWLALALAARRKAGPRRRPAFRRPLLEALEDRALPSNYTAASVSDLIKDINHSNVRGGRTPSRSWPRPPPLTC
jgi:hypothetical protein